MGSSATPQVSTSIAPSLTCGLASSQFWPSSQPQRVFDQGRHAKTLLARETFYELERLLVCGLAALLYFVSVRRELPPERPEQEREEYRILRDATPW